MMRRGGSARGCLHPGHQHARLRVGWRRGGGIAGGGSGRRETAAASIQVLWASRWDRSEGEARGHVVYGRVESHATGSSKGYLRMAAHSRHTHTLVGGWV